MKVKVSMQDRKAQNSYSAIERAAIATAKGLKDAGGINYFDNNRDDFLRELDETLGREATQEEVRLYTKLVKDKLQSAEKQAQAEGKGEFKIICTGLMQDITEDTVKDGAVGKTQSILYEDNLGEFDSFEEMLEKLASYGCPTDKSAWTAFEPGRITTSWEVGEDNEEIVGDETTLTKREQEGLKSYLLDCNVYFEFATVYEPSPEEIAQKFGISIY